MLLRVDSTEGLKMTMRYLPLVFLLALLTAACAPQPPDPLALIDQAIAVHGGDSLDGKIITFDFRGRQFRLTHDRGFFQYERLYTTDTTGLVREVLNNDGFRREIDGVVGSFDEDFMRRMETSVNSVAYFVLLPFKLADPAVMSTYLGEVVVEGEPYHKVEVRFQQEGGGRDYQDWFVYWFHQERHTMDYLSYYYYTDEEGARFRKAVNPRRISGILFTDHLNFKADTLGQAIERFDEVLAAGGLMPVSEVILDSLTVTPLSP